MEPRPSTGERIKAAAASRKNRRSLGNNVPGAHRVVNNADVNSQSGGDDDRPPSAAATATATAANAAETTNVTGGSIRTPELDGGIKSRGSGRQRRKKQADEDSNAVANAGNDGVRGRKTKGRRPRGRARGQQTQENGLSGSDNNVQIGAIPVQGTDPSGNPPNHFEEFNSSSEYGNTAPRESLTHQPAVLDAELAEDRNGSEDIPVYDATPYEDREEKMRAEDRKRRRCIMFGVGALVVVIVSSVLGAVLGTRSGSSSSSESGAQVPTPSPNAEEFRRSSILDFLVNTVTGGVEFESNSPHEKAADWILGEDPMKMSLNDENLLQRFLLVLLYFQTTQTGEKSWSLCNPPNEDEDDIYVSSRNKYRWLTGRDECEWFGIVCLNGSQINGLNLAGNSLIGPIPSELGLLTSIQAIDISANDLGGTIPEELYNLTNLIGIFLGNTGIGGTISTRIGLLVNMEELFFRVNNLSGTIPKEIGNLEKLRFLVVEDNKRIAGPIPDVIYNLTTLQAIGFGDTSLRGTISTRIGALTNLVQLITTNTDIGGTIPTEIGLCAPLDVFEARFTGHIGTIPSEIGQLSKLSTIRLAGNQINGTIPEEFYELSDMEVVDLEFLPLTGTLSTRLGQLTDMLQFLVGFGTDLVGPIPSEIGNLRRMNALSLANNLNLGGPLPSELFTLPRLDRLILDGIGLTTLDTRIGLLSNLRHFSAINNRMEGEIPSEVGRLTNLSSLSLASNFRLGGPIPESIYNLTNLETLNFAFMRLSGTISTRIGLLLDLEILNLRSNQLTGTVPTEIGLLTNLVVLDLDGNPRLETRRE